MKNRVIVCFLVIALASMLGMGACGGSSQESKLEPEVTEKLEAPVGGTIADENTTEETIELKGAFYEMNHGYYLNFKDSNQCTCTVVQLGDFLFSPLGADFAYEIEGNHVNVYYDTDMFYLEIDLSNSYPMLVSEKYCFIPEEQYLHFTDMTVHSVGDTVQSDSLAITVKNVISVNDIPELAMEKGEFVIQTAPEGMGIYRITCEIENISNVGVFCQDKLSVSLIYDNTYVFNSWDTKGTAIVAGSENYCVSSGYNTGLTRGEGLPPLTTKIYNIYMTVPDKVLDDSKNLHLLFTTKDKGDIPSVAVYNLRG